MPQVLRKLCWQSTQHIPTMVMSYGRTIHIRNHKSEIFPIMKPSPVLVPYNLPCYHHRIILVLVALVVGIIYNSQTKARTIPGIYICQLSDYMLPIPQCPGQASSWRPCYPSKKAQWVANLSWRVSNLTNQRAKTVNQPNPICTRIGCYL